ncbi:UbiA prenyltransferase family [Dichomitus squalens]|nr:UbiA prenyltransferase family [Dichomitus squalens]
MYTSIVSVLYGFTGSDIMGILIPTTAFGTLASGSLDPTCIAVRGLWVWLHLLQFCVSNQSLEPEEDRKNKPWRPIPSGALSMRSARTFRWGLLVACLAFSAQCGALIPSAAFSFATWAHNEAKLGSQWISRNVLNGIGYSSFSVGASYVGCSALDYFSASEVLVAQMLIFAVISTTIQAQDFKDVEGDILVGRQTLPIVFPIASRIVTVLLIPVWSFFFAFFYPTAYPSLLFLVGILGAINSVRFWFIRTRDGDKVSYLLYNVCSHS